MCGIVGYVGNKRVVPVIIDGLKRLEYRGYDSAGIAVCGNGEGLQIRRAEGKLRNLEEVIRLKPLDGTYGIGHTRWATHGRPTEENAHPHRDCSGRVVVVHNGIIENYVALKRKLIEEGHRFTTETDTEVIAHLVEKYFLKSANGHHPSLEEAVRKAVGQLTGVFALAVIAVDEPNKIVAARNGPPAVIGLGKDEYFVASDVPAILYHTRDLFFLADGDLAVITPEGVRLTDFNGQPITRQVQHVTWDPIMAEKGGFKHFMLKEIYEQPRSVRDTTLGRTSQAQSTLTPDPKLAWLPPRHSRLNSPRCTYLPFTSDRCAAPFLRNKQKPQFTNSPGFRASLNICSRMRKIAKTWPSNTFARKTSCFWDAAYITQSPSKARSS